MNRNLGKQVSESLHKLLSVVQFNFLLKFTLSISTLSKELRESYEILGRRKDTICIPKNTVQFF